MRKISAIFVLCFLMVLPLKLSFAEEQEQYFCIQLEPMYLSVQGFTHPIKLDISNTLSIGQSCFCPIWYNTQVAPFLHEPHRDPEDFWQVAKRTLKFLGVGLALNLRF